MWPQDGRRELRGQGEDSRRFSREGTHFEQETQEQGADQGHSDRSWGRMEDVELHLKALAVTACVSLHYVREAIHPPRLKVRLFLNTRYFCLNFLRVRIQLLLILNEQAQWVRTLAVLAGVQFPAPTPGTQHLWHSEGPACK